MIVRTLALGGLTAAGVAHAEPAAAPASGAPDAAADPAVDQAREANLESNANRTGMTFAIAGGPSLIVGFGIDDSVGRSGTVNLRLGHVATPRTVITLEVAAVVAAHRPAMDAATTANTEVDLLVGAQYYVNPSLWLHSAGGVGIYQARQVPAPTGGLEDRSLSGPAALAGVGVEVVRFRGAVLDVEAAFAAMLNRDGVLLTTSAAIGLSFD